jgi:glycerol transport system substrate-binding protein
MDGLARDQDAIITRLEKSGAQGKLGLKTNEERDPEYWYAKGEKDGTLAPQRKLANEKPPGETIDYDVLVKTWTDPVQEVAPDQDFVSPVGSGCAARPLWV